MIKFQKNKTKQITLTMLTIFWNSNCVLSRLSDSAKDSISPICIRGIANIFKKD